MTQTERTELSVRCQMILSTGPAVHDEEEAWDYVRRMAAAIRTGRESLDNLLTIEQLAELWRLKHQRERVAPKAETVIVRAIRRNLGFTRLWYAALLRSFRAGGSA